MGNSARRGRAQFYDLASGQWIDAPLGSSRGDDMRRFLSFASGASVAAPPRSNSSAPEAQSSSGPHAALGFSETQAECEAPTASRDQAWPPQTISGPEESTTPLPQVLSGGHLHYGGSTSRRTGALGCKPEAGRAFRVQKRMEMMVRLENAAVPDAAAAAMLSLSLTRYKTIKKSPEYLRARTKITLGIIVDQAGTLEQIREQRREVLTQMLPTALQVIANAIHRPAISLNEQKLQIAVAQDVLDREGTFAKVSRSEVRSVDAFDWTAVDERGRSILDVLRPSVNARPQPADADEMHETHMSFTARRAEIEETLEISRAFSSGQTLDAAQQQDALQELERATLQGLPPASRRIQ